MLKVEADNPIDLFMKIAEKFLSKRNGVNDYEQGQRIISYHNVFSIEYWSPRFTGDGLYRSVGYIPGGGKMTTLRKHYVNEANWDRFKQSYWRQLGQSYISLGMNFKRLPSGSGGCLGSFELIGNGKNPIVFMHSKVAEFPKRFTADMKLVSALLNELHIENDVKVIWYMSAIFTMHRVFYKAIRTLFGDFYMRQELDKVQYKQFMKYDPGILEGTQRKILKYYNSLKPWSRKRGLSEKIDRSTGCLVQGA